MYNLIEKYKDDMKRGLKEGLIIKVEEKGIPLIRKMKGPTEFQPKVRQD